MSVVNTERQPIAGESVDELHEEIQRQDKLIASLQYDLEEMENTLTSTQNLILQAKKLVTKERNPVLFKLINRAFVASQGD